MTVVLKLDSSIYPVGVVQRAAYSLIDRLVILIAAEGEAVACEIEPVSGSEADFDLSVQDFKRELLDQALRAKIKTETEPARNLILAYTFSRARLQE